MDPQGSDREPTTAVVIQPSYIPWRGYFDLIRKSDIFVFYDDVQYDKHGWRNRNRIKTAQGARWLTIPVHARRNTIDQTRIDEVEIDWTVDWRRTHLERLHHAYSKAPHYRAYRPFVEGLYSEKPRLLAEFTINGTLQIARELGIQKTRFLRSSDLNASGKKTERLVGLLLQIGATHYISGPSARAYIEEDKFAKAGISLEYMNYEYQPYEQLHPPYEAGVSVLDLLFMKGPEARSYFA
jgi:WbqC-like protein family